MTWYMDNFTILYSIIGRNTIILTTFAIFCHCIIIVFAKVQKMLYLV